MRRAPSTLLAALAVALHAAAAAQSLTPERMLPQPVEPGQVAPWTAPAAAFADPGERGSLQAEPAGPTLADWYAKQGRPAVVLFFDRRLERLPHGWDGAARLNIAHEKNAGGKTETQSLTVALEHKSPVQSVRRAPIVQLVENALAHEMQRQRFKLVDPNFVERALAAKGKGGDTEFDAIKGAAGYVLEVELAATGPAVSMLGGLKNVGSGELVATIRQPVDRDLREPADADALARSFIKRLLAVQTGER